MDDLLSAFLLALVAAVLAVAGNGVLQRLQNRAKAREELRQFVRDLHGATVDTVVDLDLLLRRLRSPALGGSSAEEIAKTRRMIEKRWEGDLLRRVRRLRFGHPDPDVRRTAEFLEDDFWPLLGAATKPDDGNPALPWSKPMTAENRSDILDRVELSMAEFRLAVYEAPRRDVPRRHSYSGFDLPSRTARAMNPELAAKVEKRRRGGTG